jgi:hypothetical protein
VPVPKGRGARWQKVAEVLSSLDWERLECLDAKGGVLHVLESDDDPDDFDDEDPGLEDRHTKALAKTMFGIMRNTLAEARKMFEVQTKGNAELVAAMTEGLHQLAEANRLALQVHIASAAGTGGAGEADSEWMKMVMMWAMQNSRNALGAAPLPPKPPAKPVGGGHP